jgi:cardiolipin synthase
VAGESRGGFAHTAVAALLTAAQAAKAHRREPAIEIVWTGQETPVSTFRRTEQALLEVVESASLRLWVVSSAVYHIPRIRDALVAAAERGVRIRLIIETANEHEGKDTYQTFRALGERVASVSAVYH